MLSTEAVIFYLFSSHAGNEEAVGTIGIREEGDHALMGYDVGHGLILGRKGEIQRLKFGVP